MTICSAGQLPGHDSLSTLPPPVILGPEPRIHVYPGRGPSAEVVKRTKVEGDSLWYIGGRGLFSPAHPKKTELRASNHHVINLAGIARDTTTAMGKNKRKNDRLVQDMLDFKTSIGKRDAFYCFR